MAFTNLRRARQRLRAVPVEVRKAVKAQLKANANELAATQKRFAPVDSGALRSTIRAQDVSTSAKMMFRVSAGGAGAPYARWVEFGTSAGAGVPSRPDRRYKSRVVMTKGVRAHAATPAQPFFWPAYRIKRRRFRARLSRAARNAIEGALSKS